MGVMARRSRSAVWRGSWRKLRRPSGGWRGGWSHTSAWPPNKTRGRQSSCTSCKSATTALCCGRSTTSPRGDRTPYPEGRIRSTAPHSIPVAMATRCARASTWTETAWAKARTSPCSSRSCAASTTHCSAGRSDRRSPSRSWIRKTRSTWLVHSGPTPTAPRSSAREERWTWRADARCSAFTLSWTSTLM